MTLPLIPARAGSKGVPGKNLRELAGKPLIAHSILAALEAFGDAIVSTDCPHIADVARGFGATVIDRPADLAQDETPMAPVVDHALHVTGETDSVFLLQPTSPFRSADDIRDVDVLLGDGCDSVLAVTEAPYPPAWALSARADGCLYPVSMFHYQQRRQDLPAAYLDGPVYAITVEAWRRERRFLTGATRFVVVPADRGVDIDTEHDFLFAEFVAERRMVADAARSA